MTPSRRLAALFCAALVGVLVVVGVVVAELAGPVVAGAYVLVVVALLAAGAVRARRTARAAARPAGHACSCCSGGHAPVQVV